MKPAGTLSPQDWMTDPRTRAVMSALTATGLPARFVGGCVRNAILGRAVGDIDIATSAAPAQAIDLLQKAGLKAIYLSGWQVAGDANLAGEMYPDQSLYPANSVPMVVKRINNTFQRADQIQWSEGKNDIDFFAPIVADAEAGFGGVLNAFELMKAMIEAGASGVHFEDQLASVKKCGHMGGKVLVPTREAVEKLNAARLAADVSGTPTILVARTDAEAADLLTSDVDELDRPFCTGERTVEGFFRTRKGFDQAVSRGLAYAPYADLIWCETGTPDLEFARNFAEAIHRQFPGKIDRKSTRLNSSHSQQSRMPSSA